MENIIEAQEKHRDEWLKMALDLWPDEDGEELKAFFPKLVQSDNNKVLLYGMDGQWVGFLYASIRTDYVEGSDSSPTGHIEGIYVKPRYRRRGVSRQLVARGEQWVKDQGCHQIGSDIYIDNTVSYDFHTQVGFKEAGRLIHFIKNI